jgi:hypothetical protein
VSARAGPNKSNLWQPYRLENGPWFEHLAQHRRDAWRPPDPGTSCLTGLKTGYGSGHFLVHAKDCVAATFSFNASGVAQLEFYRVRHAYQMRPFLGLTRSLPWLRICPTKSPSRHIESLSCHL